MRLWICLSVCSVLFFNQFKVIWTQDTLISVRPRPYRSRLTTSTARPIRQLTMCYLVERNGTGMIYDYNKATAAMDLALDYANHNILPSHLRLTQVYRDIGNVCSAKTHIVGHALGLKTEEVPCVVYIGPGCGTAAEVLNNIAEAWDIPMIACPAAGVGQAASMREYYEISRTSIAYTTIAAVMLRYFVAFNYTSPVFLLDQSVNFFQQMGLLVESTMKANDDEVPYRPGNYYQFSSATITRQAMAKMLRSTTEFSRVVVICANSDTVRRVMIVAGELVMASGDYVFLAVELYRSDVWGDFTWRRGLADDESARAAFPALLLLSLQVSVVDQSQTFWREVIQLSRNKYNYNFTAIEQKEVDPVVVHFYETILLYAQVVKAMDAAGKDYLSGRLLTATVANFSFVSPITGLVAFNKDSDRLLDYTIRQYNAESQQHEVIMAFPATSKRVTFLGNILWFGKKSFPANTPFCGFKNENPACIPQPVRMTSGQTAAAIILPILLVLALAYVLRPYLRRLLYGDLDNYWWRVYENDVTVIVGGLRTATSKSLKSALNGSVQTHKDEDKNEPALAADVISLITTDYQPAADSKEALLGQYAGSVVSLFVYAEPRHHASPMVSHEANMRFQSGRSNISWKKQQLFKKQSVFSLAHMAISNQQRDAPPLVDVANSVDRTCDVSLFHDPMAHIALPYNMVRNLVHSNIQKFIGIAVDDSNECKYLVLECCQKGSLRHLILKKRINLDWEFRHSLIKDLTSGMAFIQSSSVVSHGFLSDTTCQIDSRFVLKIADVGFPSLRHDSDLELVYNEQEDRDFHGLLWRAPEHLRRRMPPSGTPKGDAYSYAIIMQQLITLSEPFQSGTDHGNHNSRAEQNVESDLGRWRDIVLEVKRHSTPPMRPPIPTRACPAPMHDLVEQCWDEDPAFRPNFARIRTVIKKIIGKSGDNIIDHLVHRMDLHTKTLEHQVHEQITHFNEERQRAGDLLKTVLPISIADAILQGTMVYPEKFDSVTIYVGSVQGFDEATTKKPAYEVIKLLNQVYNVCDDVIAEYDVFKVETIRDTYLLASGVPIRNGTHHAEEMTSLALAIRKDIASITGFNSKLAKNKPFKLRVGLHTGSVMAGLIGHTMPKYCLFGDTLTIAGILEKRGEAGKVQCSEATKLLLEDLFVVVERRDVEISLKKGLGKITTFWILGKE